jgi:hypothetical protein
MPLSSLYYLDVYEYNTKSPWMKKKLLIFNIVFRFELFLLRLITSPGVQTKDSKIILDKKSGCGALKSTSLKRFSSG